MRRGQEDLRYQRVRVQRDRRYELRRWVRLIGEPFSDANE